MNNLEILHPLKTNLFRVRFDGALLSENQANMLATSVMSAFTDLKNKTLELVIQQPQNIDAYAAVMIFLSCPKHVDLDFVKPDGDVSGTMRYSGIEVEAHNFGLTYVSNKPSKHFITLSFKRTEVIDSLKR